PLHASGDARGAPRNRSRRSRPACNVLANPGLDRIRASDSDPGAGLNARRAARAVRARVAANDTLLGLEGSAGDRAPPSLSLGLAFFGSAARRPEMQQPAQKARAVG